MSDVTVVQLREGLSDLLGRAQHGGERVRITRNGKPVAAIVSVEDLELLRALEDRIDLDAARAALQEAHDTGYLAWETVRSEDGR
ncbi:MAG TPA: type II toxin-antitoxin system Phd/YefM family antitoxin [Thermomicrobiales bacterium]|nr:type II toxin-antitoxin system Phd/YefM family antitoxin [Thermomicrobiales bacterium]